MLFLLLSLLTLVCLGVIITFRQKNSQIFLLLAILVSFVFAVISYILYISRDVSYYPYFLQYFLISKDVFHYLSSRLFPARLFATLLNGSCLVFIFCNFLFVLTFSRRLALRRYWPLILGVFFTLALEWMIYDPRMYVALYRFFYPAFIGARQILALQRILNGVTYYVNIALLLGCIAGMIWHYLHAPRVRFIRHSVLSVTVSYSLLIAAYLMLFSPLPTSLVKYSKIASIITYISLTRYDLPSLFLLPVIILPLSVIMVFVMHRYSAMRVDMVRKRVSITQRIDASALTTRVFCHYMKNEILALQFQIDELPVTEAAHPAVAQLQRHCNHLCERLNMIHRNVLGNTMQLTSVSLAPLMARCIADVRDRKKCDGIALKLIVPPDVPDAFVDEECFRQALVNIIDNAVEALASTQNAQKRLDIVVQYNSQWLTICIRDNGPGIARENLDNIFMPLFSSKPQEYNWGMGLSLAFKIISACHGHLNVESAEGVGTAFEILLPNIYPAQQKRLIKSPPRKGA
ncbi:MAG: HAMP domain-containing histidine kinase [Oscillospiraceae bacterium]|jgi:signal transduction histidine kinase|nr:HAMP domain-containing histidine kinase [Oscillospiraceae bacterium]